MEELGNSIPKTLAERICHTIMGGVQDVPKSTESRCPSHSEAKARASHMADIAATKVSIVSGGMAIVPGPLGILTIIPALLKIWQLQRQLVADIASCYGKTAELSSEMMLYCLFCHGSATVFKETIIQVGGRLVVRRASLRVIQNLIQKISVNVTQRVIGQFVSRWLPILGSVALGMFSFWDTKRIAATAIDTFEKDIEVDHRDSLVPV